MNTARIKQLHEFLNEDPSDPFSWYALALEYQKDDPSQALELFEKLLRDFEDYIPAYYQAASLMLESGKAETAILVLKKGIQLARQHNDNKTMGELSSLLNEIIE